MTEGERTRVPMRFLARILPSSERGEPFLSTVRSLANTLGVDARNPKWSSYGALEIDLFADSAADVELLLSALEPLGKTEFTIDLGKAQPYRTEDAAVAEARRLFDSERYWEAHEVLEGVWRSLEGEEKLYVQGVILVCAAFVHHQKGEDAVALNVLRRAEKQLSLAEGSYHGISTEDLRVRVEEILSSGSFVPFRL